MNGMPPHLQRPMGMSFMSGEPGIGPSNGFHAGPSQASQGSYGSEQARLPNQMTSSDVDDLIANAIRSAEEKALGLRPTPMPSAMHSRAPDSFVTQPEPVAAAREPLAEIDKTNAGDATNSGDKTDKTDKAKKPADKKGKKDKDAGVRLVFSDNEVSPEEKMALMGRYAFVRA